MLPTDDLAAYGQITDRNKVENISQSDQSGYLRSSLYRKFRFIGCLRQFSL